MFDSGIFKDSGTEIEISNEIKGYIVGISPFNEPFYAALHEDRDGNAYTVSWHKGVRYAFPVEHLRKILDDNEREYVICPKEELGRWLAIYSDAA